MRKTALSVKDRRLSVVYDDAAQPVSDLALAVSKLDLGKGSTLEWPVSPSADAGRVASAVAAIPGVRAAKADHRVVLITFSGQPAVTLAQLDAAAKGAADAAS